MILRMLLAAAVLCGSCDAATLLKQSTAVTVKIGPFVDATDGVTAETALTITQADVRLSKAGGNMAQKTEASAATHDELGYYDVDLDATDTATLGPLRVMISESGALPVWEDYMVVPANHYDTLVAGSDSLDVELTGTSATNQSAIKTKTDFLPSATAGSSGGVFIVGANTGGITITNSSGNALGLISSGGNGNALYLSGNGAGDGINAIAGATGDAVYLQSAGTGRAIYAEAQSSPAFLGITAAGDVLQLTSGGSDGDAIQLAPEGAGAPIRMVGQTTADTGNLLDALLADTTVIGSPAGASIAADIAAIDAGATSQPRINYPPTWQLKLSNRNDGTHRATRPVRLRAGAVDTTVGVDCSTLFGRRVQVATVGAPTVSGGSITATELGPRDELAMIQLAGTATADEEQTVTFTVTAENGDSESVTVDVEVFSD